MWSAISLTPEISPRGISKIAYLPQSPKRPRFWRLHAALSGLAFAMSARAVEAEPATDNALATLCGIVETSAKQQGLPIDFFTRLR